MTTLPVAGGGGLFRSSSQAVKSVSTKPKSPGLTRARVIAQALALADDDGLDKLSMRQLASALGVEAMSLYNHVENKQAILDGMADLLIDEMDRPLPGEPWWTDLAQELAHSYRQVALRHPNTIVLLVGRDLSCTGLALLDQFLEALVAAGIDPDTGLHVARTLVSFVSGAVIWELSGQPLSGSTESDHASSPTRGAHALTDTAAIVDHDTEFGFGLGLIIKMIDSLVYTGPDSMEALLNGHVSPR